MVGKRELTRRDLVGGFSVATATAIAGCAGGNPLSGGGGSMSWEEAFEDGTTAEDRAALEPTPVAVDAVDSQAEVETALAVLGWTLAVEAGSGTLVADLEAAVDVSSDLEPTVTRAIDLLGDGLALVQEMKETSALGTSVWDVAVATAPSLDRFVDLARDLRGRLERQRDRLRELAGATATVVDHLRSIRETGTTAYGEVGGDVQAALSLYGDVVADVDAIRTDVQQVLEVSLEGREAAGELPVMGRQVAAVFGTIADVARQLDDRLAAFRDAVDDITTGLDGLVDRAGSEATDRYATVSRKATGSAGELSVTSVRTDVQAYGAAGGGASDGADGGDDGSDAGGDDGPTVTDPPTGPGEYVTKGGSSDRGSFEFLAPTRVPAGQAVTVEGTVTEAPTEQYGGFTVAVDGQEVASLGLQAGETESVSVTKVYHEAGRAQLDVEVRFTNSDHGTNELVGRVSFDLRVVG